MGTENYTKEELSTLTPEELSALELENGDEDILNELAGDEDQANDDSASDDEAAKVDASASAEPAKANEETPSDDAGEQSQGDAIKPIYQADSVADSSAERTALLTQKNEAFAKLIDGEITAAEYSTIENDVLSKIRAIDTAEVKAQVANEMTQQQMVREWEKEVNSLVASAKKEGLDYVGNQELNSEFDTLIRVFSNEAAQNGMSDEGLKASKWALAQAHSVMKTRHGIVAQAPKAQEQVPAAEKAPRHSLQTLSGLPNADRAQVDNDTISRLGGLVGEDLEMAMATMSEKDVNKLLASVSV
jgi:hypothetical protein